MGISIGRDLGHPGHVIGFSCAPHIPAPQLEPLGSVSVEQQRGVREGITGKPSQAKLNEEIIAQGSAPRR